MDLPDGVADVVISNCVINLCPDKEAVYREAFRILKPGGRLAISDIVYTEKTDPEVRERFQSSWVGCVGGSIEKDRYFQILRDTGFTAVEVVAHHPSRRRNWRKWRVARGRNSPPFLRRKILLRWKEKWSVSSSGPVSVGCNSGNR